MSVSDGARGNHLELGDDFDVSLSGLCLTSNAASTNNQLYLLSQLFDAAAEEDFGLNGMAPGTSIHSPPQTQGAPPPKLPDSVAPIGTLAPPQPAHCASPSSLGLHQLDLMTHPLDSAPSAHLPPGQL